MFSCVKRVALASKVWKKDDVRILVSNVNQVNFKYLQELKIEFNKLRGFS